MIAVTSLIIAALLHHSNALDIKEDKVFIHSVDDFKSFSSSVTKSNTYLGTTVYLETDLDLSSYTSSIGDDSKSFDGVFDGQGHVIDYLVPGSTKYIGLFGRTLKGITIRNLIMGKNCLFKPQDIMNEPFTSVLVGKCNAVYNDCRVENVVTLSMIECTKAFVRHSYLGAAFGGCEADKEHICYIRNMVNYGKLYYHSGSSNELYLGGFMSYCKGNSGTVTPACIIENSVNYGSNIFEGSLATVAIMGGILSIAERRVKIINVAQFESVMSRDRLDGDYYIGAIIGKSDGGSSEAEKNVVSRTLWSNTVETNRGKHIDYNTNTVDSDVVASFDPSTFIIDPSANAEPARLVDFFNEYVAEQNVVLLNTSKTNTRREVRDAGSDSTSTITSSSTSSSSNEEGGEKENSREPFKGLREWLQVSFDSHGGSKVMPRAFLLIPYYNELVYPLDTPTKGQANFLGWYMDGEYVSPFNYSYLKPGRTLTLHAKWSFYNLIFDSNGGSDFTLYNDHLEYRKVFTMPKKQPEREGYVFVKWVPQGAITAINSTFYYMPSNDITFKAYWKLKTYSVRLYTTEVPSPATLYREYGLPHKDVIRFPRVVPERTGYKFVEWLSGDALKKEGDVFVMPARDCYFYPKWEPIKYTVQYFSNDDGDESEPAFTSLTFCAGDTITHPTQVPTKAGYTFDSWKCTGYNLTVGDGGNYVMPAQDIAFYAQWIPNSYTVTVYDDESTQIDTLTVKCGDVIPYPTKTKEGGYTMYWYTTTSGATEAPKTMPASDITVYGRWDRTRYYLTIVTIPDAPGTVTALHDGDLITLPSVLPSRTGYTFVKWTEEANCKGAEFATTIMGSADVDVYACWEAVTYTVTTHSNYGAGESATTSIKYDEPFNVTAFKRPGYSLKGWCRDIECTTGIFTFERMPAENLVLYAAWELAKHTFCVDKNDKSEDEEGRVECALIEYDTLVVSFYAIPRRPDYEGHSFLGWTTDPSYRNMTSSQTPSDDVFVDVNTFKMPDKNVTFYAVWGVNDYVIFFEPGEGVGPTLIKEHLFGAKIDYPTYTRENYIDKGWYTDEYFNETFFFNSSTMPSKSIVLYKRWEGVPYKVTFDTNKGKKIKSVDIPYDTPVDFNREYVPERDNCEFGGWFLNKKLTEKCLLKSMPAKNLKLYARWKNGAATPAVSLLSLVLLVLLVTF